MLALVILGVDGIAADARAPIVVAEHNTEPNERSHVAP